MAGERLKSGIILGGSPEFVGPKDGTGRNIAIDTNGRPVKCAECGRQLYAGERAAFWNRRWYGREGTCVDTHQGNWKERVEAKKTGRNVAPSPSMHTPKVSPHAVAQPAASQEEAVRKAYELLAQLTGKPQPQPKEQPLPTKTNSNVSAGTVVPLLNDAQRTFCEAPESSSRLLAPAGCGKTHSLLWRCAHLAKRDNTQKPKFLLFTFTRAARDELRDRVRRDPAYRDVSPQITVTTLNAWGFRRLKTSRHNLQLRTNKRDRHFDLNNVLQSVWQRHDRVRSALTEGRSQQRATIAIVELMDLLKTLGFRHDLIKSPADVTAHLQFLESCGMRLQLQRLRLQLEDLEILKGETDFADALYEHFMKFWIEACVHLFQSSLISLEDQKYWAWIDVDQQIASKSFWGGAARYHYILVDEFQDINPLDLGLLKAIATINKAELTIIGDDDQAIYEWRGATPDFILNPEKHLGATYKTHILGMNYRSPKNIVDLSQRLIAHNKRREQKAVQAASTKNAIVEALMFPSLPETIDYVVELVKRLLNDKNYKNVAIIGRKRSQIIPYQIVLAGQNIPFYAAEDLQLFLSDAFNELKQILAICARSTMSGFFGANPVQDLLTLCDKVRRYPIKKQDRQALSSYLISQNPKTLRDAAQALLNYNGPLKGENVGGRMSLTYADAIFALLKANTVAGAIAAISDHFDGLQKDYGKSIDDIFYADPPFLHLSEYSKRYGADFQGFYEDIEKAISTLARIPPEDDDDAAANDNSWKLPLHLMTALRAKGKEFDAVIILDANEGIWPSKLAATADEFEQERRVFYVAMTRAKRALIFLVNEEMLNEAAVPTPYLAEMGLSTKAPQTSLFA